MRARTHGSEMPRGRCAERNGGGPKGDDYPGFSQILLMHAGHALMLAASVYAAWPERKGSRSVVSQNHTLLFLGKLVTAVPENHTSV